MAQGPKELVGPFTPLTLFTEPDKPCWRAKSYVPGKLCLVAFLEGRRLPSRKTTEYYAEKEKSTSAVPPHRTYSLPLI